MSVARAGMRPSVRSHTPNTCRSIAHVLQHRSGATCLPIEMVSRRSLLAAALLLLIACTATGVAAATGNSSTICDTAKCGKGTCSEVSTIVPWTAGYKCTCDPGWSQPKLLNLPPLDWAPCMVPECSFDSSCYNFSFLWTLSKGLPLGDPCVFINCGSDGSGECKHGTGWNYTCECPTGCTNFLNLTMLPCMKNCAFGEDCSKLGLSPTGAPPPKPSAAAPAPDTVCRFCFVWRLLQQLLSLAILLLQLV